MTVREVELLFRNNSGAVLRRANELLRDPEAARDVMQDVFVRALNAEPERSERSIDGTLGGWLYRITTNLCLDRLRDARRRRRILSRWESRPVTSQEPGTDAQLTARALLRLIPDDMQTLAVHYFVDQMSHDEIASVTGVPRRTISYRLEKFRVRARALLAANDGRHFTPGRRSIEREDGHARV